MKLELKHLAPYLPHGLQYNVVGEYERQEYIDIKPKSIIFKIYGLDGLWIKSECDNESFIEDCKPILRPLSDLTKQIKHNENVFYPIGKLHNISYRMRGRKSKGEYDVQHLSLHFGTAITTKKVSFSYGVTVHPYDCRLNEYWVNRYLIEWHFDVFGLIEKGLAIDINTL